MIKGSVKCTVISRDVNWSRFKEAAKSFKARRTEVGLPEKGSFRHNAESRVKRYKDLLLVALYNEFGAKKGNWLLPERALFRTTFNQCENKIQRMMNAGARDIVMGEKTVETVLFEVGEFLTQKIKDNLIKGMPPPNAERTVAHKGFNHPLLETGQLYDNIQHKEYKSFARRKTN